MMPCVRLYFPLWLAHQFLHPYTKVLQPQKHGLLLRQGAAHLIHSNKKGDNKSILIDDLNNLFNIVYTIIHLILGYETYCSAYVDICIFLEML